MTGKPLGEGRAKEGGRIIGASIVLFLIIGLAMMILIPVCAGGLVRIPVAWYMSLQEPVSLFHIGPGIPASTVIQIGLCFCCYFWVLRRKLNEPPACESKFEMK